jgi:hypothetical protein
MALGGKGGSPMKVKLFWKQNPVQFATNNARDLEDQINAWLGANPRIKIMDIKQSNGGGSFFGGLWFVSVWYEESAATTTE